MIIKKKDVHQSKQSIFLNTMNKKIYSKFILKTIKKRSKKIQIPTLLKKEQSLAVALKKIQKGAKEKLASLKFKEYNYTPTSKNLEFLSLSHSCNFSFKKFYSSSFSYSTQMKTMLTQNHKISIFKEQQDIAYARTDLRYIWWANVSKKTK